MKPRSLSCSLLLAPLVACGGGSNPSKPDQPTPVPGSPVSGYVYYDENANGLVDPAETVRLPGVTVSIGGRTAQTGSGGRFTVENVPQGAQSASVQPASLPAYFTAGTPSSVTVPQASGELAVPATLALGPTAHPNLYMGFGDSITVGDGSSDRSGYRGWLTEDLRAQWGKADVVSEGETATRSNRGESRIASALARRKPSHVLILYGTNDYNEWECINEFPCFTIDALRSMIVQTREAGAFPVLGTIPPVNPNYADRNAEDRNAWVTRMNQLVRALATEQRVALADVHRDLLAKPSLPALFTDFLHPNDEGYRVLATSFFNAITRPVGSTTTSSRAPFSFGFTRF